MIPYGLPSQVTRMETYLEPTQKSGAALFSRKIEGSVVMLNLLRFRAVADYAKTPDLAPESSISGREAFQKYIDHTLPFLSASGGEIVFMGNGGSFLIGPEAERWDMVLLVRQKSLQSFLQFASNEEYLKGMGHRTAALEDARLLPVVETAGRAV